MIVVHQPKRIRAKPTKFGKIKPKILPIRTSLKCPDDLLQLELKEICSYIQTSSNYQDMILASKLFFGTFERIKDQGEIFPCVSKLTKSGFGNRT